MQFKGVFATLIGTVLMGIMSISASLSADSMNCGWDCCSQNCCDQAPVCNWGYNPSANQTCGCNPCGSFANNLTGRVDFLWWRPYSEGLQLGTTGVFSVGGADLEDATTFVSDDTKVKEPNFKFDPGFRLGIGYYCPSSCWDIAVNWTHFHSKAKASGASDLSVAIPGGGLIGPGDPDYDLFFNDWTRYLGTFPQEVSSRWSLDMDLVDLEFAQKFYVNHCFILRPHFGLRFARIDQNNHVEAYSNTFSPRFDDTGYDSFSSVVKAKNDFRGAGPRLGLDMEINAGCGFFLFGKAAVSLLFGEFTRNSSELIGYVDADIDESGIDGEFVNADYTASDDSRYTVTTSDVSFGLRWEHCFECCNRSHPFALTIAWEQCAFYDLNKFVFDPYFNVVDGYASLTPANFNSAPKVGNLTMQGLTISAFIGF